MFIQISRWNTDILSGSSDILTVWHFDMWQTDILTGNGWIGFICLNLCYKVAHLILMVWKFEKIKKISVQWGRDYTSNSPTAHRFLEILTHPMTICHCTINLHRIININLLHLSWVLSILNPLWASDSNDSRFIHIVLLKCLQRKGHLG